MSSGQAQPGTAWPPAGGPPIRASDADRDQVIAALNAAFAEGRLTAEEHADRLNASCQARTWAQLGQLTSDLPAGARLPAAAARQGPARVVPEVDPCLLCLLLIVCPPAGIAWWLLARGQRPAPPGPGLPPAGLRAADQAGTASGRGRR